jgi:hypothetical protein
MMTDYLMAGGMTAAAGGAGLAIGFAGIVVATIVMARRRQATVLRRLDDRITHLAAGVSLLTNTTEDGLRSVALEIARLTGTADPAPRVQPTARERIAAAAGHGRSVQDIAASEQVSEGEVLLHLLLDKLKPDTARADA